jgi:hypothetical protein
MELTMSTTSADRLQAALVELTPAQAIAAQALAAGVSEGWPWPP